MAADEKITVKIDGDDTGVRAKLAGLVGDAAKIGENFSKTFGAAFSDDFSQTVKSVVDTVSGLAGLMTNPWGIAVAAIGGVATAIGLAVKAQAEYREALINSGKAITELFDKMAETSLKKANLDVLIGQYAEIQDKLSKLKTGTEEYSAAEEVLNGLKQQLIDLSGGIITQYDLENGQLESKLPILREQIELEEELARLRREEIIAGTDINALESMRKAQEDEIATLRDTANAQIAARNTLEQLKTELNNATVELTNNNLASWEYEGKLSSLQTQAEEVLKPLGMTIESVYHLGQASHEVSEKIGQTNDKLDVAIDEYGNINLSISQYNAAVESAAEHTESAGAAMTDAEREIQHLNQAYADGAITYDEWRTGIDNVNKALNEQSKATADAANATKGYEQAQVSVAALASEQISANNELAAAIEKVKGGKALDAQETLNLISKYPELAKYYADTGDAAFLNGQKLIDLANASAESADVYMENERRKTETAIAETRERLAAYKLEAQAFMISAEGDSSALDIAIAEARALADLERKLDDINIAANLSALSMDDFNDSLNDSGGAGNAAAEAVNKLDEEYREKRKIIEDDIALGKQSTEDLAKFLEEQVEVTGLSAELKTEIAKELYKNAQEQAEKDRQLEEKNLEHQLAMGEITKADYMEMIQERLDSNREKIENEELTAEQQSAINDRIRTDEQALHDYQIELDEKISDLEYQQAQEEMALAEEISEAFIEGLRERYDEQRQMAEKDFEKLEAQAEDATNLTLDQLDAQIQATKDAKRDMLYAEDDYAAAVGDIINDGSRQRIDTFSAEYDKQIVYLEGVKALQEEINKVSDKYDADIAGYEDEIKNLEDLKEAEDEARRAEEELKRVLDLEDRIAEEEDPEKQAELEQQLYELLEEQRYRAWQKEVQDEIEWNREQIERLEEEKKTEIEALEEKQADLQETRVIWLDKEAAQMQEHYDRLMTAQNTHNELAKVNMETGMAVIVATITEFNPAYVEAGEGLGDSLIEGLASKLPEYQRILDSMLGARRDAEEELDELEAEREAELDFSAKSYVSLLPDGTGTLVIPKFTNVLAQNAIGSGIVQAVAAVASSLSRSPQTVIDRAAQSISKTHSPTVNAYFYGQQATSRQNIYDLRQMMERMAVDFD